VCWERAERSDVRAFVEHLRETPNPQRLRRSPDAPPAGAVNPRTGTPSPGDRYAARTINHQLSVLLRFYDHACAAGFGPLVNPVPAQRGRDGGRVFAHHNAMEDFVVRRRATYRRKSPKRNFPSRTHNDCRRRRPSSATPLRVSGVPLHPDHRRSTRTIVPIASTTRWSAPAGSPGSSGCQRARRSTEQRAQP
jgi:hypothetical protein